MEEDLLRLNNTCADLVTLEKYEAFPTQLLAGARGDWVAVRELCVHVGIDAGDVGDGLFVTWLPEPTGQEDYATILFYDDESGWTLAATYNRSRLSGTLTAERGAAKVSERT
jgi:hypothetical protein